MQERRKETVVLQSIIIFLFSSVRRCCCCCCCYNYYPFDIRTGPRAHTCVIASPLACAAAAAETLSHQSFSAHIRQKICTLLFFFWLYVSVFECISEQSCAHTCLFCSSGGGDGTLKTICTNSLPLKQISHTFRSVLSEVTLAQSIAVLNDLIPMVLDEVMRCEE